MRLLMKCSILALGLSAGGLPALAADLVEPPPILAPEPVVETAGWYIRGDVGYVFENDTSGNYAFYNQLPGVEGIDDYYHYDRISLDNAVSFGAGAGYRFTDNLRVDATLDYFKADVDGRSNCPFMVKTDPNGLNLPFDADCHYEDTSEAEIWTAMANAYVDVGHYGVVTPYIGAGLGGAHVSYDVLVNNQVCGSPNACPFTGRHEGEDSWRFASSLMAGASFDLTQQLKLDAGYRYTRISEGDAFGYDAADIAFGARGVQGRDNGFDVHTVRAGLRYEFGGAASYDDGPDPYVAAPVYAETAPRDQAPVYK